MRKKLHPLVLTIAILQVVFGGLALLCDGFGVINAFGFQMMSSRPAPTTPSSNAGGPGQRPSSFNEGYNRGYEAGMTAQMALIKQAPGYIPEQYAQSFVGLLLAVLMLASGAGLFFMQSWARWLAIGYGVISLFARIVFLGYHAVAVLPILNDVGNGFIKDGHPDLVTGLWGLKWFPFVGLLLGLYPLLVMVLLLLPAVGRAFRGEPAPNKDFDDYREYYPRNRDDDRFR
jgi:hypothetical protein